MITVQVVDHTHRIRRVLDVTLFDADQLTAGTAQQAMIAARALVGDVWLKPKITPDGADYSEVYGYKVTPSAIRKLTLQPVNGASTRRKRSQR